MLQAHQSISVGCFGKMSADWWQAAQQEEEQQMILQALRNLLCNDWTSEDLAIICRAIGIDARQLKRD